MLGATMSAGDYLSRVCDEIQRLDTALVENVSDLIEQAYDSGHFVFIIGNGGSVRTRRIFARTSPSAPSVTSRIRSG